MKWTPWLLGSLAAMMIAGCGGERRNDTGTTGDAGTETGTMQGEAGTPADTAVPGTADTIGTGGTTGASPADTATGGARMAPDTNQPAAGAAPGDTARHVTDSAAGATH